MPDYRRCKTCPHEYPLTAEFFHRVKRNKYGLDTVCKYCRSENRRREYRTRPDLRQRAIDRASRRYYDPDKQPDIVKKVLRWNAEHHERRMVIHRQSKKRVALRKALDGQG